MQAEKLIGEKFPAVKEFVSEVTEMQRHLNEQVKINRALEKELAPLKRMEEEFRGVVTALREQLADCNAEKAVLAAGLEDELKERKRIEEEFRSVRMSLERQLARREAEMELTAKNLQDEIQAWKQALAFRSRFLLCTSRKKRVRVN